jgi:hypothetical protein
MSWARGRLSVVADILQNRPLGSLGRAGLVGLFAVGCAIIVLASGSWSIPAGIPRGVGYISPPQFAEAALRAGAIDLRFFDVENPGGKAGNEDIGYAILVEAWALMGGDCSFEAVAHLHNVFVLACAAAFATGAAIMTRGLLAGWFCLALALVLRHALRGFLFGVDDPRTLIAFFPLAFVLLVILVGPATRRIHRAVGIFSALAVGGIVETADLVRHSEGLLAFCGILLACLLVKAPLWRRTATLLVVVLGSSLVMYAVPMSVRLFNDVRTGRYEGRLLPYLRPTHPSFHAGWHTLLISLGRYPNPEGLYYNNLTGILKVRLAYPDLAKTQEGELEIAPRAYYLWYVRAHTLDWLHSLARGMVEVFYFIPYATSVGSFPWVLGYLPAKEGVVPGVIEDPRDVPFDLGMFPRLRGVGYGILLNLRPSYLRFTFLEWAVFIASLACAPVAVWVAGRVGDVDNRRIFVSLLAYVGLGVGERALIPTYGQALVVAYWGVSILALAYLLSLAGRALTGKRVAGTVP